MYSCPSVNNDCFMKLCETAQIFSHYGQLSGNLFPLAALFDIMRKCTATGKGKGGDMELLLLFVVFVVEVDFCALVSHIPDKHILNDNGGLCYNQSTESYSQGD
jgi:hypothetical protein